MSLYIERIQPHSVTEKLILNDQYEIVSWENYYTARKKFIYHLAKKRKLLIKERKIRLSSKFLTILFMLAENEVIVLRF